MSEAHPLTRQSPAESKRKRKHHPKSKGGCITCKKVKCDERHPHCRRCFETGFECSGYALLPPKGKKNFAPARLLPKGNVPINPFSLVRQMKGSSEDRRCFEFFCSRTLRMLSSHFDEDFWDYLLPQIAHSEDAIWHSVLALSSLHEQTLLDNEDKAEHRRYALCHYNEAVGRLKRTKVGSEQSIEVLLVGCILFICLETFLGDVQETITHLHGGIEILRSRKAHGSLPRFIRVSIEENIAPIFDHLNCSSFLYGRISPPTSDQSLATVEGEKELERFVNPRDARHSLLKLLTASQQFAAASSATSSDNAEYPHILLQKQSLICRAGRWRAAFDKLMKQPRMAGMNAQDFIKVTTLGLQHKMASIWAMNALHTNEMSFDAYVREYAEIVSLAESIINVRGPMPRHIDYSFQIQNLSPLYLTAIKCRNPTIRRKALDLLKRTPRRARFWDSDVVIKVVERVIELEEEGLEGLVDSTGKAVPSEWARIHFVTVDPSTEDSRKVTLTFRRKPSELAAHWQVKKEIYVL
ncbi:uncharacterized protein PAC_02718 [Phialocephala subalpina]|uniref:Zn(2)-C6 fungal-type domain-containing protein n=1 Tax=Phialocephala subalpina TaxID=576137 RepID=A0A1L7WJA2_9HELO|nr:uncharacterized protein PAC_02718 [Phialocephala subalpina]